MKNFQILENYVEQNLRDSLSSYPTLKAIFKYMTHSSRSIIKTFPQRFSNFYFSQFDKNAVLEKIRN